MKNLCPQNQISSSNEKFEITNNQFGFNSMSLQYQQKVSTQLKQSKLLKESELTIFASREQFFSQRRNQTIQEIVSTKTQQVNILLKFKITNLYYHKHVNYYMNVSLQ
ncbi:hypothetical protein ABPG72_001173 [Tetrahymena utriculariae]